MNNVCVKCGNPLAEEAAFCGSCGHVVELSAASSSDGSDKKLPDIAMVAIVGLAVFMPIIGLVAGIWTFLSGRKQQGKLILGATGVAFLIWMFLAA